MFVAFLKKNVYTLYLSRYDMVRRCFDCMPSVLYTTCDNLLLPGREKLLPGKTPVGESPKFWDTAFLRIGTEFFPANLRIVEFNLHKDSNNRQNTIKIFRRNTPVYIFFHFQLDGTGFFPGKIGIRTEFSPQNFSGQRFSLPGMVTPWPQNGKWGARSL